MALKTLRAGFTGKPAEPDLKTRTQEAARYVRDEAAVVAGTARDHPAALSSTLLVVATLAFVAGYLVGGTAAPPSRSQRFWSW
ncbi:MULTISPECIES: hypothetical protein [Sinorhizobium]|uniref:Uncharacterized protein n=1 Tax=Sinorhizobium mexicanum TaxID=375549 RepID=A0A859QJI8_9HYPH|nr:MULTISPECIES: hypothetical protein [Sinorhizobium]MBP1884402.1 hypothetical protein [Sinorhizobium mexicanum]MDK1374390.1 hypothetical protein [Sinorhizobium sp. 6-70]MDK1478957.1 hypothetical protein [Sinorhizobium sp. 6-117]QLL65074.1 hypothetical protein FKV68_27315 [Sinorhizobium mexicanum]